MRFTRLYMIAILGVTLFGSSVVGVHAAGNTWTVNSWNDNGSTTCVVNSGNGGPLCELRDAINKAQNGDAIQFTTPQSQKTLSLTAALPAISHSITISGGGLTVIDGAKQFGIFTINGATVTLSGLHLTNGAGGAVYNSGTLTLTNDDLSANGTPNSWYPPNAGGAIFNIGTLSIDTSVFDRNIANDGGALYNGQSGTVTVANSMFTNNKATSVEECGMVTCWYSDGVGGAINNYYAGHITITGTIFRGNNADSEAGAIENSIFGSTYGVLNVDHSVFDSNMAPIGGGIDNIAQMTITNSTFVNNQSSVDGAGVYTQGFTSTIASSTFWGNSAVGKGGGIITYNTLIVTNSTIANNSAGTAGGVEIGGNGILDLANSTITGNTAGVGGGLHMAAGGNNVSAGSLNIGSTILAQNTQTQTGNGADIADAASLNTVSFGNNVIGTISGITFTGAANDQTGTDNALLNPQLNALRFNPPGTTQTESLLPNSPAVGKGFCAWTNIAPFPAVTTDQRGVPRATPCDTGAYEGTFVTPVDTIGIYRSGTFYLALHNTTGFADITVAFNPAGKNLPVIGDWTGSGFDTIGVFNQNTGNFTLCNANVTTICAISTNQIKLTLGNPNDTPLAGRWQISATHAGAGVYRPSNGVLYLKNALTTGFADNAMVMGLPGDKGIAGDWTGKGFDSPGVFRPSGITFYLSNQVTNGPVFADITATYGSASDVPIAGDWIAQGHDGIGMFRASNGYVYLKNAVTTGFADNAFFYGTAGDIPVAGHWQDTYPPAPPPAQILIAKTPIPAPNPDGGIVPGDNQIGG